MKHLPWGGQWLFCCCSPFGAQSPSVPAQAPNDASFLSTLGELREATYSDKAGIVERLSQSGHPSTRAVLTAFLEDRLYFRNSDQKIFIAKSADADPLNLIDPLSLKDAGSASADSLTQIGTNNGLTEHVEDDRGALRVVEPGRGGAAGRGAGNVAVAGRPDRGAAARAIHRGNKFRASRRKSPRAWRWPRWTARTPTARLKAIATLSKSVSQDVRNRLALLLDKSPDGSFVESDAKVRQAAAAAVITIDRWRSFYSGIETMFFGLSLGSVLVLIAIGLAITFGVMGVINMAHGELMMLGAYTTYAVQIGDARTHRDLDPGGDSGGVYRRRAGGRPDGAHDHPISLRKAPGDAARDVRREPHPAASGPVDLFGAQPVGRDTRLDERLAAGERRARDHLQPALHRDLHR